MMDEVLIAVRDLLKNQCTGRDLTFYAGDIGLPMRNELPVVIVAERETKMSRPHTAGDQYIFGITVRVITDVVESMSTAGMTNRIVDSRQKLRKIMEEADTDGAPKTDTILGCLMRQSSLHQPTFEYNLSPVINYNPPSPQEFWYIAAEIRLDFLTNIVQRKS